MSISKWHDRQISLSSGKYISVADFVIKYSGQVDTSSRFLNSNELSDKNVIFFMGKKFFYEKTSKRRRYFGRREYKLSGGEYTLRLHELVFMLKHGELIDNNGKEVINHKNNDTRDNRDQNLEKISQRLNIISTDSKSYSKKSDAPRGIGFCKRKKRYYSRLRLNDVNVWWVSSKDREEIIFINQILRDMYLEFLKLNEVLL